MACQNQFHGQYDYVLIGRRAALGAPFPALVKKLEQAIVRVHQAHPKTN